MKIFLTQKKFGEKFEMKNLGEYHDLYLKTDVFLLVMSLKIFGRFC